FEHFHRLRGTVSRGGRAVDLSTAIEVVAKGVFRARNGLDGGERGQRHRLAVFVAHVEQAEVFGFRSKLALRLNINLPLAAKAVEIVYEGTAHKGLESFIDFAQVHALFEGLVAVNIHEYLRDDRQKRGAQAGQFG